MIESSIMHPSILFILLGLPATLALLGWVGWRFFLAPAPLSFPVKVKRPPQATPRPAPAWRERLRSLPRPAWPIRFRPRLPIRTFLRGRSPWWLALPLALAMLTALTVVGLSRDVQLAPLEGEPLAQESQVRHRLNPERLVPPPPLPPSFFLSAERPDLGSADRDWSRLDGAFAQTILQLFARMKQGGYPMVLIEGYRSPERQEALAAQGPHVTHARGMQSRHQYGLAADLAFQRDGRLVLSERDPWAAAGYELLGRTAQELGLVWGGNWSFRDLGHVESRQPLPRPSTH